MITYEDAIRIIDEHTPVIGTEFRPLAESSGYALGADLIALSASPPFDNSAVDGYGRRLEDLSTPVLRVIGEVRAGDNPSTVVRQGEAIRIFTGAAVPDGIAAVAMQEDCLEEGGNVRFESNSEPGDHIRRAGSDFHAGTKLLSKGALLSPPMIGLALSGGQAEAEFSVKPRVTVLTTGDELVDAGSRLSAGKIYNSNGPALAEAASPFSSTTRLFHQEDDADSTRFMLQTYLQETDVLISCGGVSVGSYDFLKEAFAACGVQQRFWQVAIKPGKPIYFGTLGKTLVFGLPGNPVSALVTFLLFAQPALRKMAGIPAPIDVTVTARFAGECRKKAGRTEFLRGAMTADGEVRECGEQGSHQLASLAAAECLIHFPSESEHLRTGDQVVVTPIRWGVA